MHHRIGDKLTRMLIADAHLDLAFNVCRGRDVTRPAAEQPAADNEIATVGFPDLRSGHVSLVCATIFCAPGSYRPWGYRTGDEANAVALRQLDQYAQWQAQGLIRLVHSPEDLAGLKGPGGADTIATILLLEGADALRGREDVEQFVARGLRIVGLAWRRTRLAGGTGAPGPLTDEGRSLLRHLDDVGIIHDTSHLADESFWELLDRTPGAVMASHSNCRAIVPTDRQLSDAMIKALIARGGVIGINFYDEFLMPPQEYRQRRCTLADVVRHVQHIADLTGATSGIALGTDMDGGLGREQIPAEIRTAADLPRVADALSDARFDDAAIRGIMGENWLRFFRAHLRAR